MGNKMTLKSSPLVWSLAFMVVAFLALTKGAPTTKEEEEIQDHPYSFLIHHPSESVKRGTDSHVMDVLRTLVDQVNKEKKGAQSRRRFYTTRFGKKKRSYSSRSDTTTLSKAIDDLIKDATSLQRPPIQNDVQRDILCTKDEENCFPIVKNYS